MSDHAHLAKLGLDIEDQRKNVARIHDDWVRACILLNTLEREHSSLFRKMMDAAAASRPSRGAVE